MDRTTETRLIKEIIGLAAQRSTHLDAEIAHSPIARYADADRFAQEQARLFRRKPMIAAHGSDLPEAHSFLTKTFLGLPLLLTRDAEGVVHAFLNVCRHRGATLEREAKGCKRVFTCPYHAWSFTQTGDLRAVPQEKQGFPDLPREDRGLRRLPVAEKHGFIWIIADANAGAMPDLDAWIGPELAADFDWMGLSDHRVAVTDSLDIKANWKTLFEGGLEAYHFRVAHKATIAPYFPDNLTTYQAFGPHMRNILPRSSMPDLHSTPEHEWQIRRDANLLYTLVPTTQMLVQQDHVMWFQYEPLAVDLTRMRISCLVPKAAPQTDEMQAHWEKNHKITWIALKEDFDIGEEIQTGFASGGNPSHIFGRFEGALHHLNTSVEEMLAE